MLFSGLGEGTAGCNKRAVPTGKREAEEATPRTQPTCILLTQPGSLPDPLSEMAKAFCVQGPWPIGCQQL